MLRSRFISMKTIILLALGCLASFAQPTAYLRTGLPNTVFLSSCSNNGVSPIVCTSIDPHAFVGGEDVWFANVCGPTVLNGRNKVGAVTGSTTFTVTNPAGGALTSNGNWVACADSVYVGRVAAVTLTAAPRAWFDGPSGVRMREMALTSSIGLTSLTVSSNVATVVTSYNHPLTTGMKVGIFNSGTAALDNSHNPYTITKDSATQYHFTTSGVSNGTYTSGTVISSWAWTGLPNWDRIVANPSGDVVMKALRWLIDPSQTTSRDAALTYMQTFEQGYPFYGNFSCNESLPYCSSSWTDYGSDIMVSLGILYDILRPYILANWSSGDKTTLNNKIWADLPNSCAKPSPVQTTGTITQNGTTTIVGSGTSFLSEYIAGDIVFTINAIGLSGDDRGAIPVVVSVADDTHMTVTVVPTGGSLSGQAIYRVHQWGATSCGLNMFLKYHIASIDTDRVNYPTSGGAENHSNVDNRTISKTRGSLSAGFAWADDDARALTHVENVWPFFRDMQLSFAMNMNTGPAISGTSYNFSRVMPGIAEIVYLINNATGTYEDYDKSGSWLKDQLNHMMYLTLPDANPSTGVGCGSNVPTLPFAICTALYGTDTTPDNVIGGVGLSLGGRSTVIGSAASYLNRSSSDFATYKDWVANLYAYSQATNQWNLFLYQDPNVTPVDYTTQPLQHLFRSTGYTACAALHGSGSLKEQCTPELNFNEIISRSGWTSTSSQLVITAMDMGHAIGPSYWSAWDHSDVQTSDYQWYKGGNGRMLGTDVYPTGSALRDGWDDTKMGNMPRIGNATTALNITTGAWQNVQVPRWGGTNPTGPSNNSWMYGMTDLTGLWATGVTTAHRNFVHAHKTGLDDELFTYDYIAGTAAGGVASQVHYAQIGRAGEGSTACPSDPTCASVNTNRKIVESGIANNLISKYLDPTGGSMRVYVETGLQLGVSNVTGGYPGGNGNSFRVPYCTTSDGGSTCDATASNGEFMVVHRISTGTGDTTLTATLLSPDSNWTGAQTATHVVLFSRGGTTHNAITGFTTTHSGTAQYVFAGLTAGTYTITVGGVGVNGANCVSGTCTVASGDTTAEFESTAGVVSVNGSAPPSGGGGSLSGTVTFSGRAIIH